MAITPNNTSLPGVYEIIDSAFEAISDFSASIGGVAHAYDKIEQEYLQLKRDEQQMLEKFGGEDELRRRLHDFQRDAEALSGMTMGMEFTFPYQDYIEKQKKQYLAKFLSEVTPLIARLVGKSVEDVTTKDLDKILNLNTNTIVATLSTNGLDHFPLEDIQRRRGGQVKNSVEKELVMMAYRDFTQGELNQLQNFVKTIEKQFNIPQLLQNNTATITTKTTNNTIEFTFGYQWADLTKGMTASVAKTIYKNKPNELEALNQQIVDMIRQHANLTDPDFASAFEIVMRHMLNQNEYLFFKGKNYVDVSGIIGEIGAMVLFYDLVGSFPSVQWAAQHRSMKGGQQSVDLILDYQYGVQVKHSAQDLEEVDGLVENFVDISKININTLGAALQFDSNAIRNLYDAYSYNLEYTWARRSKHTKSNAFSAGENPKFAPARHDLEANIELFERLLTHSASALLFMNTNYSNNLALKSGSLGDNLYIVNFELFLASEVLGKIMEDISRSGKAANTLKFTTSYGKNKGASDQTIIGDLPAILLDDKKHIQRANQMYLSTAYNFV